MEFQLDEDERVVDYNKQFEVKIIGKCQVGSIGSFEDAALGLNPQLLDNLKALGYDNPTAIQANGMPQIMAKLDTMCSSCTGSGKTAAYLLPIITLICKDPSLPYAGRPKALILVPTRELAEQICKLAREFCKGLHINVLTIIGGIGYGHALHRLRHRQVEILVATPGRLLDLLTNFNDKPLSLADTKMLVIDEADEMFNRGFFQEINAIVKDHMMPKEKRLTAMFSATFPIHIRKYAEKHLRSGFVLVLAGTVGGASPDIIQEIIPATQSEKLMKLLDMIAKEPTKKMLVFCNTIEGVDALAFCLLKQNLSVAKIHSELTQYERDEILANFDVGKVMILVATSVAARGLNIKDVAIVVNYDLPDKIEHYIQRIGRARTIDGEFGVARSFFDGSKDFELVTDLKIALSSTYQTIPDFLMEENANEAGNNPDDVDDVQIWMNNVFKKHAIRGPEIVEDEDGF